MTANYTDICTILREALSMIIPEKNLMKLANGSDVRGVAIEGVADEPVTLSTDAANVITSGFLLLDITPSPPMHIS